MIYEVYLSMKLLMILMPKLLLFLSEKKFSCIGSCFLSARSFFLPFLVTQQIFCFQFFYLEALLACSNGYEILLEFAIC